MHLDTEANTIVQLFCLYASGLMRLLHPLHGTGRKGRGLHEPVMNRLTVGLLLRDVLVEICDKVAALKKQGWAGVQGVVRRSGRGTLKGSQYA
jgi:hypothetical protein